MKKLLLMLSIIALSSCQKRGEIYDHPQDFIEINGKIYKLISIVPADGCYPIWIMYPKDSTESVPTVLNYEVKNGKTNRNQSVIKID
jgi:hypothetical protein